MTILVINGPNLNTLGRRQPQVYGTTTLAEIESSLREYADRLGMTVEFFQSNSEGALIDYIQEHQEGATGIIINAGALTHYGLALRDCLAGVQAPIVEVHLSNIYARESFRSRSVLASIAKGQISGLGWRSYLLALDYLASEANAGGGG